MTIYKWNECYDNTINKYWKSTKSKRLEEILTKLDSLLEEDFQSYYLIHSKFSRLLIKKQQEELNYIFFGYKAKIDAENFVNSFLRTRTR
jgi:hypothetical protein